jgi:hypothetical protein
MKELSPQSQELGYDEVRSRGPHRRALESRGFEVLHSREDSTIRVDLRSDIKTHVPYEVFVVNKTNGTTLELPISAPEQDVGRVAMDMVRHPMPYAAADGHSTEEFSKSRAA